MGAHAGRRGRGFGPGGPRRAARASGVSRRLGARSLPCGRAGERCPFHHRLRTCAGTHRGLCAGGSEAGGGNTAARHAVLRPDASRVFSEQWPYAHRRCRRRLRTVVCELLHELNFSLQANCKTREGDSHPDRDAQFCYINDLVKTALIGQQPVISVDTKKKELVGDFKNGGRQWRPKGQPGGGGGHDFLIKELGRAVPYGIYDLAADHGWVSVGMDHDTAAFAVQTIRRWWQDVGRLRYPDAKKLMITADGGGSNGSRLRPWHPELQRLANELGIDITISHFPPGTSKWNKIEHRLFSFISQNWRATPLVSYRVIINLIAATTTRTGLSVHCELDTNQYPKGIVVSDDEMDAIAITRAKFHGEWNYTISPNNRSDRAVDS